MQNFKIREIKKDDNEQIKKLFRENIFNKMSYRAHSKAFKIINGFDKHFLIPLPYPIFQFYVGYSFYESLIYSLIIFFTIQLAILFYVNVVIKKMYIYYGEKRDLGNPFEYFSKENHKMMVAEDLETK